MDELVAATGASGATIRRDLEILAANGVLKRVHGGARSLVARGDNPGYGQRELEDHETKLKIAAVVDALLKDREHVWLDSGSTATEIARRLSQRELTVMPMSLHGVEALTHAKEGRRPAAHSPRRKPHSRRTVFSRTHDRGEHTLVAIRHRGGHPVRPQPQGRTAGP
ncbi:hypothetical protein StoSoilB13_26360 (plasmid) [Arthrobacter sp. StoSoilB13]|nr:hypothetical protein StoSoilB13_26360 [Arthrobacter sp. StoSoilB13]